MKRAFVVDFDGTIMEEDVGLSIIRELAQKGWENIGRAWINKEINTAKCGQMQWNLVKYDENYIKNFISKFKINRGFREFVNEINKNYCEMIIASDGYDVYIKEILKKNGFENIKVSCNKAVYNKRWILSFLNNDKECTLCGNCKKKVVNQLKKEGYKVYYIGDGYSDRCACSNADVIFAKSFLKQYCEKENIPHYSFNDFSDILGYFQKNNWLV